MIGWVPLSSLAENKIYAEALDIRMRDLLVTMRRYQARETFRFYYDDLGNSLTTEELLIGSAVDQIINLRNAYVIGIGVYSSDSRTAGSAEFWPTVNDSALTDSITLDGTNAQSLELEMERSIANFISPGDRIGVDVTTSADWAPMSADIIFSVIVEYTGED